MLKRLKRFFFSHFNWYTLHHIVLPPRRFRSSHFLVNSLERKYCTLRTRRMVMNMSNQKTRPTTYSTLNLSSGHSNALNESPTAQTNGGTDGGRSGNRTPTSHLTPLCTRFSPIYDNSSCDQDAMFHAEHLSNCDIQKNRQHYQNPHFPSFGEFPSSQGCRNKLKYFFEAIANDIWMPIRRFVMTVWLEAVKMLPESFGRKMASPEKASNTRTGPTENTDLNDSGTNEKTLNTGLVPIAINIGSRRINSCMERNPDRNVTTATKVQQQSIKINKIDLACRLLTISTVHMEIGTAFQPSNDGCRRQRRFVMVFTRKGPCFRSLNVAMENDAIDKTGKLTPLISVGQGTAPARKRFGKHFGTKIRRSFKKFGRAVRRTVAPSTETVQSAGVYS